MSTPTWRERIKVHPAADLFPMMSDDELDELAKDIAEHGLRNFVTWFHGANLAEPSLLDGRNRAAAIARIPDKERRAVLEKQLLGYGTFLPNHNDPIAYVISTNVHRRHLTHEKKREVIAELLKARPERSDRETARIAKVSDKTVGAVRADLEAGAEIPHQQKRVGADGVAQAARKPSKPPKASEEAAIRAMREASAAERPISKAGTAFYAEQSVEQHRDSLKQILSLLKANPKAISDLDLATRVRHARAFLAVLNLTLDDLRARDGAA
jgi:hypothetical protein